MRGYIRSQVTDLGARKPSTPFSGLMGRRSGTTFTPASIAGLSLWVDSSNASSLITNGAGSFASASTQYLSVASNSTLQVGDLDFWLAGWVNFASLGTLRAIVSKDGVGSREYLIRYTTIGNCIEFRVSSDGTTETGVAASTFGAPSTGVWYFVMAYHDSVNNVIKISINGGVFDSAAWSSGVFVGSRPFQIGGDTASIQYMDGQIDSVAFGKSPPGGIAAIATTIRDVLYNSGSGVTSASITSAQKTAWGGISWWDMASSGSGLLVDSWGTNTLTNNNGVTCVAGIASGMATSDGDPISQWIDLSGNNNSITQATFSKRPILKLAVQNGNNVVRFDGVDDDLATAAGLGISGNFQASCILAFKPGSASAQAGYWGYGNNGVAGQAWGLFGSAGFGGGSSGKYSTAHAGGRNYNPTSAVTVAACVTSVIKSAGAIDTTTTVRLNGVAGTDNGGSSATTPNLSNLPFTLGSWTGSSNASCDAYEVLMYSSALSAGNIALVESYLFSKWGIP